MSEQKIEARTEQEIAAMTDAEKIEFLGAALTTANETADSLLDTNCRLAAIVDGLTAAITDLTTTMKGGLTDA